MSYPTGCVQVAREAWQCQGLPSLSQRESELVKVWVWIRVLSTEYPDPEQTPSELRYASVKDES